MRNTTPMRALNYYIPKVFAKHLRCPYHLPPRNLITLQLLENLRRVGKVVNFDLRCDLALQSHLQQLIHLLGATG